MAEAIHNLLIAEPQQADDASRDVLPCPACRSFVWDHAFAIRGVPLTRCRQCGLLGTTHFVTQAKAPDGLYEVGPKKFAEYQEQYAPHRRELYTRFLPQLEQFRQGGRLLEIGSGYGDFLQMAAAANWQSEGVEISAYGCEVARSRGCKVYLGQLEDAPLATESFDVIALWDVIEHFTHPDDIIRQIRRLLRAGGALILRTPDARALAPARGLVRSAYRHLVYPANTAEHIFHFTPDDLTTIATNLDFEVAAIDFRQMWKERVISANSRVVWAARWAIMLSAHVCKWPYEFVLIAVKPSH